MLDPVLSALDISRNSLCKEPCFLDHLRDDAAEEGGQDEYGHGEHECDGVLTSHASSLEAIDQGVEQVGENAGHREGP